MLNPAIGKLIRNSESRYKLVLEVAKKARAIAQQAEENKDIVVEKPVTIAINEMSQNLEQE
ncbi:MAG: DNA-directed RNA polymerase subunit omega [bacterium]|nr:DNA-directed RNA polymerase subunit omega [bacterium]